jgi:phosphoglycerol transferase MdoB-like AlkP superfamily enzyme
MNTRKPLIPGKSLWLILLGLIVFILVNRVLFYLVNREIFALDQATELFSILKGSLVFDFPVLWCMWTIIAFVFLLNLRFQTRWSERIYLAVLFILLTGYTLLNVTGALYYRDNFELPSNRTLHTIWENRGLAGIYIQSTLPFLLIGIGISLLFFYLIKTWCVPREKRSTEKRVPVRSALLSFAIITLVAVGCIRENIDTKILSPNSAFRFVKSKYRDLIVNPAFNLAYSQFKSFNTNELLVNLLEELPEESHSKTVDSSANQFGKYRGRNIFVIVIESASAENFEKGSESKFDMPFFDSLRGHSLFFTNAYANAYNSADGVKAIFSGMGNHILINSAKHPYYKDRPMPGEILKRHNYQPGFFYSKQGAGYWKGLGFAGIENYLTEDELPVKAATYPTTDDAFFQLTARSMHILKEPFVAGIQNRATHYPYHLFDNYDDYAKISKPFTQAASMRYFDDVLRNFFSVIKQYDWFRNTIFIFVGDHFSRAKDLLNQSDWAELQIPLMIYSPGGEFQGEAHYPVQQTDIPVTIMEMVGIRDPNQYSNYNLLDSTAPHQILARKRDHLLYADDSLFISFDLVTRSVKGVWNYRKDPFLKDELKTDSSHLEKLNSYLRDIKNQYRKVRHY